MQPIGHALPSHTSTGALRTLLVCYAEQVKPRGRGAAMRHVICRSSAASMNPTRAS